MHKYVGSKWGWSRTVAYAGKNFGGVQGRGPGLVGGPGAEPPGGRKIFENLQKKFLKKIAKNELF